MNTKIRSKQIVHQLNCLYLQKKSVILPSQWSSYFEIAFLVEFRYIVRNWKLVASKVGNGFL